MGLAEALPVTARLPAPALAAAATELMLLLTHGQVLFGIRPSHQYEALKARRIYFVIDLLSPWAALAVLDWNAPAALLALCAGHAALHIFYILTWHSRHTDRVIRLSSSDTHRRFGGGYAAAEVAWYYVGTAFDILTHAAVLRQLLAPPDVL